MHTRLKFCLTALVGALLLQMNMAEKMIVGNQALT
jgi:hypothetical protein